MSRAQEIEMALRVGGMMKTAAELFGTRNMSYAKLAIREVRHHIAELESFIARIEADEAKEAAK